MYTTQHYACNDHKIEMQKRHISKENIIVHNFTVKHIGCMLLLLTAELKASETVQSVEQMRCTRYKHAKSVQLEGCITLHNQATN